MYTRPFFWEEGFAQGEIPYILFYFFEKKKRKVL